MLKIDTGHTQDQLPRTKSAACEGLNVRFTDWTRADRFKRQIIEAIESIDDPEQVQEHVEAESLVIDALYLSAWPEMAEEIDQFATEHRAMLRHGAASAHGGTVQHSAPAQSKKAKTMFTIDTGDTGGSQGPWISWTSNGSAMKGFPPKSWVLRNKDEAGSRTEEVVPAFANGCVMDLDSLQLGWEKDGAQGQAPERRWNPSVSQATPRPDESKKPSGAFAWSRALSVRCAIGGGQAATWEQGSFGAYAAFEKLSKEIMAQYPGDNTLPLVKQTGVETRQLASGSANIPVLTIVKWVPRPDCLKAGAPTIAAAPAEPAPAPAPAPTPAAPAPTPAAPAPDEDMVF